MDIEIVRTVEDSYRLWDGDRFLADCGKGVEGEDRAKAVWDEIANLQLANSTLRQQVDELLAEVRRLTKERNGWRRRAEANTPQE